MVANKITLDTAWSCHAELHLKNHNRPDSKSKKRGGGKSDNVKYDFRHKSGKDYRKIVKLLYPMV
jgi:hypothetical protein